MISHGDDYLNYPYPRIPRSCDSDFHMRDENGNFLGPPLYQPSLESIRMALGITGDSPQEDISIVGNTKIWSHITNSGQLPEPHTINESGKLSDIINPFYAFQIPNNGYTITGETNE